MPRFRLEFLKNVPIFHRLEYASMILVASHRIWSVAKYVGLQENSSL